MGYNQESEDGVIREAVSHKLEISLVKQSNKVWRVKKKSKNLTSHFQTGESIRYRKEGRNEMVELLKRYLNDLVSMNYTIKFLLCNKKIVIKEFLNPMNITNIS